MNITRVGVDIAKSLSPFMPSIVVVINLPRIDSATVAIVRWSDILM